MFKYYFFCWLFFAACTTTGVPKPKGYLRVSLPKPQHTVYALATLPFNFEQDTATQVTVEKKPSALFATLFYPHLNAHLYLTYYTFDTLSTLDTYREAAHKLVYEHALQAGAIHEEILDFPSKKGIFYSLKGRVATNFQFHLSDEKQHFLRASFYFSATPNPDSLAPFVTYAQQEAQVFLRTLTWK